MSPSRGVKFIAIRPPTTIRNSSLKPRLNWHSSTIHTQASRSNSSHHLRTIRGCRGTARGGAPGSSRNFHTSRPQRDFLTSATGSIHDGICFIHSTIGLPWWATLPLVAIVLRTSITLPVQILSRRKILDYQINVLPVVLAARPRLEREIIAKYHHLGPKECTAKLASALLREGQATTGKGISPMRFQYLAPLVTFPPWLLVIETIRRMCGAQSGIAGLLFGQSASAGADVQAATGAALDAGTATAGGPADYLSAHDALAGAHLVAADHVNDSELSQALAEGTTQALQAISAQNPLFEPSLAAEGALWFPNLLVPDPTMMLSVALSAVLSAQIWRYDLQGRDAKVLEKDANRAQMIVRGFLKILALAAFPLTISMPSGMLLYWISSASVAFVSTPLVEKFVQPVLPEGQTIQQAKEAIFLKAVEEERKRFPDTWPKGASFADALNPTRANSSKASQATPTKKKYTPVRKIKRK